MYPIKITKKIIEEAKQLYLDDFSIKHICNMILQNDGISISKEAIRKRLINAGVQLRSRKEVAELFLRKRLSEQIIKDIKQRYTKQMHSIRKISRDLKIQRPIIRRLFSESRIEQRDDYISLKLTNQKHEKVPFGGNEKEKAYMTGLVKGDLTATKKSKYSLRLTVASTHKNFLEFLYSIYSKYGPVYIYPAKDRDSYTWHFSAEMDINSFNFLLKAKEYDISKFNEEVFIYFLAGFIDTDGSIYIRKAGRYIQYMLRMFGQDKILLEQLNKILRIMGFNPSLYISSKKGEVRKHHGEDIKYNKDYYILELSRKKEVERLLKILPLKHPEKIERKEIMLGLINKGAIYPKETKKMLEFRNKIKEKVKGYIKEAKLAMIK